MLKLEEKKQAISLRTLGKTYKEILQQVPVAKSTLSLWLRSVGLAKVQKQVITEKRLVGAKRGAQSRRQQRLIDIQEFNLQGLDDVGRLSKRELWLLGVALYWSEGSKQNDRSPSEGVHFINSDARMICLFLEWLKSIEIPKDIIYFELYIHENRKLEVDDFKEWWSSELNVPKHQFDRVYFKKGNPKTNRKNTADLYHGLVRIKVRSSTKLNRQIQGWIHGIVAQLGCGVIGNTSAFEAEESRIVP